MIQKLHMSLIFSNLVASNIKLYYQTMCNLYAKYVKIIEICKHFSRNLVNEKGNVPRRGVVPKFSDLEVVALTLAADFVPTTAKPGSRSILSNRHLQFVTITLIHSPNNLKVHICASQLSQKKAPVIKTANGRLVTILVTMKSMMNVS